MKILFEKFTGKRFFFVTLGVVGYFCLLCLNVFFIKSDFVLNRSVSRNMYTAIVVFTVSAFSSFHCSLY